MDYGTRLCRMCGAEFKPTTHHNVFCSPPCAWRHGKQKPNKYVLHPNGNPIGHVTKLIVSMGIRQGQSIAQIAKELDRPVEQIKEIYEEVRNEH